MKILFVCTGNTCRSPMAEGIFRKMVQEAGMGDKILCQSAGLSPVEGTPPAENAVRACREIGVEIGGHTARKLTGWELGKWDVFFTMTSTHGYILNQAGVPKEDIYLPGEIDDPYGGDMDTYRRCRDALAKELKVFYNDVIARLNVRGEE